MDERWLRDNLDENKRKMERILAILETERTDKMTPDPPVTAPRQINYRCSGYLNALAYHITEWRASKGFKTDKDNIPEKLLLITTEVAEAAEAHRKQDMGEFREELADILIRLLDLTAALGLNIEAEVENKMMINESRPKKHGKAY